MNKKPRFANLRHLKTGHPSKKTITVVRGVQYKNTDYIVWEVQTANGWITDGRLTLLSA